MHVYMYLGCPIAVTPDTMDDNVTFSDGQWHYLLAQRVITTAMITVDSVYTGLSTWECDSH